MVPSVYKHDYTIPTSWHILLQASSLNLWDFCRRKTCFLPKCRPFQWAVPSCLGDSQDLLQHQKLQVDNGWAMLCGAGLQGRFLKSSRIYIYIYIYCIYIYCIYIYILYIYIFKYVCMYIYIRQYAIVTCGGNWNYILYMQRRKWKTGTAQRLKDLKVLEVRHAGLMASEDCRVMLHFTRFAWASVYNIILIFYNSAIIFFFAGGLCIIKITILLWKKLGVGNLGLTFIIKEHMLHASLYLLHPIPLSLFTELDDGNIWEHLLDAPSFWW